MLSKPFLLISCLVSSSPIILQDLLIPQLINFSGEVLKVIKKYSGKPGVIYANLKMKGVQVLILLYSPNNVGALYTLHHLMWHNVSSLNIFLWGNSWLHRQTGVNIFSYSACWRVGIYSLQDFGIVLGTIFLLLYLQISGSRLSKSYLFHLCTSPKHLKGGRTH